MNRWISRSLVIASLAALVGCGDDNEAPTGAQEVSNAPDAVGSYYTRWTLQVLRRSDGFQKEFSCSGRMTLGQTPGSRGSAALSGFVVVEYPCAPESYDVAGTLLSGGAVELTTNGPKPTEGPCPGGKNIRYSGQATPTTGRVTRISLRGVTTVTCPEFGEHQFTYLVESSR